MPAPSTEVSAAQKAILKEEWEEFNALGGSDPRDEYERGILDTVAKVLAINEAKQAELS